MSMHWLSCWKGGWQHLANQSVVSCQRSLSATCVRLFSTASCHDSCRQCLASHHPPSALLSSRLPFEVSTRCQSACILDPCCRRGSIRLWAKNDWLHWLVEYHLFYPYTIVHDGSSSMIESPWHAVFLPGACVFDPGCPNWTYISQRLLAEIALDCEWMVRMMKHVSQRNDDNKKTIKTT